MVESMLERGISHIFASPDAGFVPADPGRESEQVNSNVGIYNESDPLTSAALWGPPGPESLVAQLYPKRESLFLATMNVQAARTEAERLADVLSGNGVKITLVRDLYAASLYANGLSMNSVISDILARANTIVATHRVELEAEIEDARRTGDLNGRTQIMPITFLEDVTALIEEDTERYGEQTALAMAKSLVLDPQMPLGNLIYARDQMNVLLGTRFRASMARPIRVPEVDLYENVYRKFLGLPPSVELPLGETFEGGDAYIHNGCIYVGVGTRTTIGAAEFIYQTLRPQLQEKGLSFAMVRDRRMDNLGWAKGMESMHLDTFSNPIGYTEIAVCEDEASDREVIELSTDTSGSVRAINRGGFMEHLIATGSSLLVVPKEEQMDFACNFLALDGNTVLLPGRDNSALMKGLETRGKRVIVVDLFESTRGYGASHCMTAQFRRDAQVLQ